MSALISLLAIRVLVASAPFISTGALVAVGGVVAGVGGLVFVALKYNREDATSVIGQQSSILADMKALNDELAGSLERCQKQRDVARSVAERRLEEAKQVLAASVEKSRQARVTLEEKLGTSQDDLFDLERALDTAKLRIAALEGALP